MKKIIFTSYLVVLAGGFLCSQVIPKSVGINTNNPRGALHVDAKGDNGSGDTPTNISDDVIVDTNGNLGLGTISPVQKVHVEAPASSGNGFRLNDQSQDIGYLLMSRDTMGTATWIPKPFSVKTGAIKINGTVSGSGNNSDVTAIPLRLAPGIWMIMAKYALIGDSGGFYFWTYLHDLDDQPNRRTPADDSNPNWYLNKSTSFKTAMSVVGMLPEQAGGYATTPTINYVTIIASPGKSPGDDGYEHEIRVTFSTSSGGGQGGVNSFTITNILATMNLGVYLYAIRLDVDMNSL